MTTILLRSPPGAGVGSPYDVTVAPGSTTPVQNISTTNSGADTVSYAAGSSPAAGISGLQFGLNPSGSTLIGAGIPAQATIASATFTVTFGKGGSDSYTITPALNLSLEQNVSPTAFTTNAGDITARTYGSSIPMSGSGTVTGGSPLSISQDITTIVTSLVSFPGWSPSSPISLKAVATSTTQTVNNTTSTPVNSVSFGGTTSAFAPILSVTYIPNPNGLHQLYQSSSYVTIAGNTTTATNTLGAVPAGSLVLLYVSNVTSNITLPSAIYDTALGATTPYVLVQSTPRSGSALNPMIYALVITQTMLSSNGNAGKQVSITSGGAQTYYARTQNWIGNLQASPITNTVVSTDKDASAGIASGTSSSTTSGNQPSVLTTAAGDLIVSFVAVNSTVTGSPAFSGNGVTLASSVGASNYLADGYSINAGASNTTVNPYFSWSTNRNWSQSTAIFKANRNSSSTPTEATNAMDSVGRTMGNQLRAGTESVSVVDTIISTVSRSRISTESTTATDAVGRYVANPLRVGSEYATSVDTVSTIANVSKTNTQTTHGRISVLKTNTQTTQGRISVLKTNTQTTQGRTLTYGTSVQIAQGHIFIDELELQLLHSNISVLLTKTQMVTAGISISAKNVQTLNSRIFVTNHNTQLTQIRISIAGLHFQSVNSRVSIIQTNTLTTQARIATIGNEYQLLNAGISANKSKEQTISAKVQTIRAGNQDVQSRVSVNINHSQETHARVSVNFATTLTTKSFVTVPGTAFSNQLIHSRVSASQQRTQVVHADIKIGLNKSQTTNIRIQIATSKTQIVSGRINVGRHTNLPSIASIQVVANKSQPIHSQISVNKTNLQTITTRISNRRITPQSVLGSIAIGKSFTQTLHASVSKVLNIEQYVAASIQVNNNWNQATNTQISIVAESPQSISSSIGVEVRTNQTAQASVALLNFSTQPVNAAILSLITKTQKTHASIDVSPLDFYIFSDGVGHYRSAPVTRQQYTNTLNTQSQIVIPSQNNSSISCMARIEAVSNKMQLVKSSVRVPLTEQYFATDEIQHFRII